MFSLWAPSDPSAEWDAWAAWQALRDDSHYSEFPAYHDFFLSQPDSFFPRNCASSEPNAKHYWYAFGVFTPLLVAKPLRPDQAMSFATSLLTVYDSNKGYSRMLTGDPPAIAHLRSCVADSNLAALRTYDYSPYAYDPSRVHAHTVAQFSLSSLLMRLLSHSLHCSGAAVPSVPAAPLRDAYDRKEFCKVLKNFSTASFWDPHAARPFIYAGNCSRWTVSAQFSCSRCARLSEALWGYYQLCLDCYKTKACYVCGDSLITSLNEDGFPRCSDHPL